MPPPLPSPVPPALSDRSRLATVVSFVARFLPDTFTLMLIAVVIAASVFPCEGKVAQVFGGVTSVAIGLLFFMHGAKLSPEDIKAGATHWRLHLLVFACTFGMFPVLGITLRPVLEPLVTPELYVGILFLCALPATVQSAIAFTAMARGNVPAAVCSASASSLVGIFLTPVLVGLLLAQHGEGGSVLDAMRAIVMQLLVPFVAGQIARRWIGAWVTEHKASLGWIDRSSILLVVYTAFSEAVIEGLWRQMPLRSLLGLVLVCSVLLALALCITTFAARRLGFSREDEITIVFCGSKKSMASGIPMAQVLFASHAVGAVVLPLMLFHQIQLMVCAVLAQRYARRPGPEPHRVLDNEAGAAVVPGANDTAASAAGASLTERRQ
ncbi:bile acid:sodium symporter [soil metagenome]